jgi:hypothetical protein
MMTATTGLETKEAVAVALTFVYFPCTFSIARFGLGFSFTGFSSIYFSGAFALIDVA